VKVKCIAFETVLHLQFVHFFLNDGYSVVQLFQMVFPRLRVKFGKLPTSF